MTDNTPLAYPADYYYPEFIYSREDEPPTSPTFHVPSSSVDNGIGSTTATIPGTVQQINETRSKQQPQQLPPSSARLGNIATNQGLPDSGMTQTTRTDPKTNLLRDPAERNIPKLIVDDSVIRQSVQTSNGGAMNFGNTSDQTNRYSQLNNGRISKNNGRISKNNGRISNNNGHTNGDITNRTNFYNSGQQQAGMYAENDPKMVDDRWKKEVYIDDNGVVTIEPVAQEEPVYDGPFGLTRKGSYIFYIGMAIFTLLAAVFLIMCGVFYAQNYPDSSTNTGKLAGIGICAFAFYLGLQMILIGIWHQKHRKENPRPIAKPSQSFNKSSKPITAENDTHANDYGYSYQPQTDFTSYGNYPNPSYAPYGTEQIPLQTVPEGTVMYPPVAWPVNDQQQGAQPDSRFLQPMEWTYGQQSMNGTTPATEKVTPNSNNVKNEKKKSEKKSQKRKISVEADVPTVKSDSVVPKSTVIEPPLPRMNKAPETKEMIEKNTELEKNLQQASSPSSLTVQNVSRIKSIDDGDEEIYPLSNHRHRYSDRHLHSNNRSHQNHPHRYQRHRSHHHHHHRRHQSHSPCSLCSRDEFYSDVGYDPHHHHHRHHHHHHPEFIPTHYVNQPPHIPAHSSTKIYRDSGVATEHQLKITKDSSVTADLEDISNDHNNSIHQVPIVRRTVIVEPYPAEPSSQIVLTPRTATVRKVRSEDNLNINDNNDTILFPHAPSLSKKSGRKKNTTESQEHILDDLNLEDVNDMENSKGDSKKKRKFSKTSITRPISNAFYDN